MVFRLIRVIGVVVVVCFISGASGFAQQESWQKIAPVGESFTILMPTQAVETSRRIPLNDQDSIRAQGIVISFGKGRAVVLGAAMLSAQLGGPNRMPFGMNHPGIDNRQLARNIVHWLSGLLK